MPRTFTPLKVAGLHNVNLSDVTLGDSLGGVSITLTVDSVAETHEGAQYHFDCASIEPPDYRYYSPIDPVLVVGRCILSNLVARVEFVGPWAIVARRYVRIPSDGTVSIGLGGEGAVFLRNDLSQ